MKTINITTKVDEHHCLSAWLPVDPAPGHVEIVVLLSSKDEHDAGADWMARVSREWGAELADGREVGLATKRDLCNGLYMYEVVIAPSAEEELKEIRAFERTTILREIAEQLVRAPLIQTRNRKLLVGARPRFEAVPPVWQLRVGEYRVFYDVDEDSRVVRVRAVRRKPPHKTTEEIL